MSTHKNTFSATNHLSAILNVHFLPGDRDRRGTRFKAPVAVIAFYTGLSRRIHKNTVRAAVLAGVLRMLV